MADTAALPDYYAKRAAEYERIYHKPERQAELTLLNRLVSDYFAGQAVLEIACGTGYWTEVFASRARSVTATDVNEEVLAIARTKGLPPSRVQFLRADAYTPQNIPGEFDAAYAGFWWSHIAKTRLADFLAALHARLPDAARVLFIDNNYVAGSSTPITRVDEEGNSYQLRRLDNGETFEVLKNFPMEAELRAAWRQFR
jgi:demethylmenaquinone methyltransferase/2-methoxy-6-polyprenyl-1,4-benzoquinol methylase